MIFDNIRQWFNGIDNHMDMLDALNEASEKMIEAIKKQLWG